MEKGERDTVTKKRKGPGAKEVFARKLPKHLCPPLSLSLSLHPLLSHFLIFSAGTFPPGFSFCVLGNGGAEGKIRFTFFLLALF